MPSSSWVTPDCPSFLSSVFPPWARSPTAPHGRWASPAISCAPTSKIQIGQLRTVRLDEFSAFSDLSSPFSFFLLDRLLFPRRPFLSFFSPPWVPILPFVYLASILLMRNLHLDIEISFKSSSRTPSLHTFRQWRRTHWLASPSLSPSTKGFCLAKLNIARSFPSLPSLSICPRHVKAVHPAEHQRNRSHNFIMTDQLS